MTAIQEEDDIIPNSDDDEVEEVTVTKKVPKRRKTKIHEVDEISIDEMAESVANINVEDEDFDGTKSYSHEVNDSAEVFLDNAGPGKQDIAEMKAAVKDPEAYPL
jgi:hypothetical protein